MKRKTLTTAVLAGLTGMAGMVSVSNAVNLNPDGLGQVLLYPYYSARGGNDTLVSIVNTRPEAKSVKVRFLEGLNSREVLDFNIYMSAFDVWVGAVTADGVGGAKLLIPDTTCTVPYLFAVTGEEDFGEQEFLTFAYTGDNVDGGPTTRERLASGYIEFIEMGELTNETEFSALAATHVDGEPPESGAPARVCGQLEDAWTPGHANSYWLTDATIDHDTPTGGLFGGASIINVNDGTMFTYNAYAIDAFSSFILHTNPGTILPDLNSGDTTSRVFVNGTVDEAEWMEGFEAVNATITFDRLMNEYVTGGVSAARSEWVVTFPTKRFHVDDEFAPGGAPIAPFTSTFAGTACEELSFNIWDREERTPEVELPPVFISPPPPDPEVPTFELCFETNVIRFGSGESIPTLAEITKESRFATIASEDIDPDGFFSGWVRFNFEQTSRTNSNDEVYVGLPVIGFWVNTFTNGTLDFGDGPVLGNFGGSFQHRGSRRIEPAS